MAFVTRIGLVHVTWIYDSSLSSGENPNDYYGTNLEYKIVVMPSSEWRSNPDIDYNDYDQVKTRFHLTE